MSTHTRSPVGGVLLTITLALSAPALAQEEGGSEGGSEGSGEASSGAGSAGETGSASRARVSSHAFDTQHTITGRPLALEWPMLQATYEYGLKETDSVFGSLGIGSSYGISYMLLGGGYRRYITGDRHRGAFVSPALYYVEASAYGLGVGALALEGTFGGKHTFEKGNFVIEGEAGIGMVEGELYVAYDAGLGVAF